MTITKKIYLLLILVFIAGIALNLIFKNTDSKKYIDVTKPSISNTYLEDANTNNIEINVDLPDLPSEMLVYSSYSDKNASSLANVFAKKYQLFPSPEIENIWIDENNNYFLSYSPISNQITFSNLKVGASSKPLNLELSIASAQEFIDSLNLSFNLKVDKENIIESTEYGNAYIVPFVQKIDDYSLYFSSNLEKTAKVFVADNQAIAKVIINNPSLVLNQVGYSKTISKNTVLSDVKNSNGIILGINDGLNVQNSPGTIEDLVINKVEVEYREDPSSQLIIPYYRFTGSSVSNDSETFFVDIIYPVIETEK